jgi:quercetin dioxygenase-like cupin family protein
MRVIRAEEMQSRRGAADKFAGAVWPDVMLEAQQPGGLAVYRVSFEPGARTQWHAHPGEQVLFVLAGNGRVQKWGEKGFEIGPGDIVHTAPGEKHWHGAGPKSFMIHIAITTGGSADWMGKVTDEEYSRDLD